MQVKIGDESHTLKEWAEITGISELTIKERYYKFHMRGTALIAPPKILQPVLITLNGETHTFAEWAVIACLDAKLIATRYCCGKRGTELIEPLQKYVEIEINGVLHTLKEWSKITGIAYNTLYKRYISGATAEEFLKPTRKRERRK